MIQYILECITFQLVFLIIYDFFLKTETFFQWNRVYLLGTFAMSFALPWVKIEAFRTEPHIFNSYSEYLWKVQASPVAVVEASQDWFSALWPEVVFALGCMLAIIVFTIKLWRLYQLRALGSMQYFPDHTRILIPKSHVAFSFFKSIFLGQNIDDKNAEAIVGHELVHIKQWHTLDLLFLEGMRILCWFNPLVYVYQNRLTELHEYIADAQVPKQERRAHYERLLSQAFEVQNISFINPFFKSSLIKKRIVMLQKSNSKKILQLKYLVLVPLVLGMLLYTSCESESGNKEDLNNTSLKAKKVPFAKIDKVPLFPGCEDAEDKRACFNEKMQLHISKNFRYPEEALKQGLEGRVNVMFTIDANGNIVNIEKRGPSPILEDEVVRIISRLPQMKPGLKDGQAVNMPYSIPVVFKLDGSSAKSISHKGLDSDYVPFGRVDEVPVFPGCENATDSRACFNEKIMRHINKNFRYPQEAQDNGIEGRVSALFTISDKGLVENIELRGPDKLLEDEVERILKRLPIMKPGKNEGEEVAVAYSIPVTFKLQDEHGQTSNGKRTKDFLQVRGALAIENGKGVFKGKVMDSESMGIPGVDILVEGSQNAVISGFDGSFIIPAKDGETLTLKFEGVPERRIMISK